jgi:DNA-binding transcriptional ArsR family regulator
VEVTPPKPLEIGRVGDYDLRNRQQLGEEVMSRRAERQEAASNRIKAMSHPVRAAALRYLNTHGEGSPSEIADETGEDDVSNVSYHMKRLVELDCAELVRTEQVRGAVKHFYRPVRGHLVESGEWDELPDEMKRSNLLESGEPIFDDFRTALEAGTLGVDEHFAVIHFPMKGIDREGRVELTEICEQAYREAEQVPERCVARRAESGEEPIRVSFSVLAFEVPHF